MIFGPGADAVVQPLGHRIAEVLVDRSYGVGGGADDRFVADGADLRSIAAGQHAPCSLLSVRQDRSEALAEPHRVDADPDSAAEDRHQAAERRDHVDRVAVSQDDSSVRIHVQQGVELSEVGRALVEPRPPDGSIPLQDLQLDFVEAIGLGPDLDRLLREPRPIRGQIRVEEVGGGDEAATGQLEILDRPGGVDRVDDPQLRKSPVDVSKVPAGQVGSGVAAILSG